MKCFEIHLLLNDPKLKNGQGKTKELRQYFKQEEEHQAVFDAIAWTHHKIKGEDPRFAVERLVLWQWRIESPKADGSIASVKSPNPLFNWSYERGVIQRPRMPGNHLHRLSVVVKGLNDYRHVRFKVKIEEIGQEIGEPEPSKLGPSDDLETVRKHLIRQRKYSAVTAETIMMCLERAAKSGSQDKKRAFMNALGDAGYVGMTAQMFVNVASHPAGARLLETT